MADGENFVYFKIHGDHLTNLARDRVLEGRWDHGLRILTEGLHGMTVDIALKILRGDAKLTGVNTVDLEDDDATEYKAELDYHFGGVYIDDKGRFMQAYAVVTSWGPEDFRCNIAPTPGSDVVQGTSNGTRRWNDVMCTDPFNVSWRSIFYADDQRLDVMRLCSLGADWKPRVGYLQDGAQHVLFKELTQYPSLIMNRSNGSPTEAAQARLAVGALKERGYKVIWPADHFNIRYDLTDPRTAPPESVGATRHGEPDTEAMPVRQSFQMPTREEIEARQAQLATESEQFAASEEAWRVEVLEQAGDDLFEAEIDGRTLVIPRAPFEHWVLRGTAGRHLAKPWSPVCPSGIKMINDDPYHTDWLIASCWKGTEDYLNSDSMMGGFGGKTQLADDLYSLKFDTQEKMLGFKAGVLSGEGRAEGVVVHLKPGDRLKEGQIGVIPNAGPDFVEAAQDAVTYRSALITEKGGAVAHLVTVFREQDLKIVRVAKARTVYPEGTKVTVNCTTGEVALWSHF